MRLIFTNGLLLTSMLGPLTSPSLMVSARKPPTPTAPSKPEWAFEAHAAAKAKIKPAQVQAHFAPVPYCLTAQLLPEYDAPSDTNQSLTRGVHHLRPGQDRAHAPALVKG